MTETTMGERTGLQVEPVVPGPDDECPGAEVVNTTTGTGDEQSPVFAIEGDSFRITTTVEPTSQDPGLASVSVGVVAEGGEDVTLFDKEGGGTESSIVNAGPGNFFLDILAANANYAVVVEDCVGDSQDGGGGGQNDDGIPDDVIRETIPDEPLPNTGGFSWLLYASVVALYACTVAWRMKGKS